MPVSILRSLGALTHEILTLATLCMGTEMVSSLCRVTYVWQGQD